MSCVKLVTITMTMSCDNNDYTYALDEQSMNNCDENGMTATVYYNAI